MLKRVATVTAVTVLVVGALLLAAPPTGAAIEEFQGTLTPADPTMTAVTIVFDNCGTQTGGVAHYDVVQYQATVSGAHTFEITEGGDFTGMYLYANSFNPVQGTANCIAASDGTPPHFTRNLTAGTTYFVVILDGTLQQQGGAWTLQVDDGQGLGGGQSTTTTTDAPSTTAGARTATPAQPTVAPATAVPATAVTATPRFTG